MRIGGTQTITTINSIHELISAQIFGKEGHPSSFHALKANYFTIDKNELFCLLGPNGAGKTTTINCLIGNLEPSYGFAITNGIKFLSILLVKMCRWINDKEERITDYILFFLLGLYYVVLPALWGSRVRYSRLWRIKRSSPQHWSLPPVRWCLSRAHRPRASSLNPLAKGRVRRRGHGEEPRTAHRRQPE